MMRTRERWLWLSLCLAALAAPGSVARGQELFLQGGLVVDPRREEIRQENLLVRGGVIAGAPVTAPADFGGQVLDVTGKWVIPALHDLHTHSYGNAGLAGPGEFLLTPGTATRMLYCGVGGFLDLFNDENVILSLRDRQRADPGAVPGADIFAAGPCLTATGGHCSEYGIPTRLIDTPEAAEREIAELAAKRPDVVKIVYHTGATSTLGATGIARPSMPTVDVPTLRAVIAAAQAHGLKTVVHVGSWADAREATLAGATAVTHVPDGPIPDDLVALMKEHGTTGIPTLVVHGDLPWFLGAPEHLNAPLLRSVVSEKLLAVYLKGEPTDRLARYLERAAAGRQERYVAVRKLAAAGIPLLTGTDAGNPGVFQGYSVHRELALFVEAGLTPWQALRASTTAAGTFLGRGYGVDTGDEASLVVLEASPIADIGNSERIVAVIHHGRVIDRAGLLAKPAALPTDPGPAPGGALLEAGAELSLDRAGSVFAVLTHRAGVAAGLAHDHLVVAGPDSQIDLSFDPAAPLKTSFLLELEVADLVVDDPELGKRWGPRLLELGILDRAFEEIGESNRKKIREAMLGPKQLASDNFPAVAARLVGVAEKQQQVGPVEFPYAVELDVTIHGKTRRVSVPARFGESGESAGGYTIEAVAPLQFTDFGIKPYSAALGAVKNQDGFHLYANLRMRPRSE